MSQRERQEIARARLDPLRELLAGGADKRAQARRQLWAELPTAVRALIAQAVDMRRDVAERDLAELSDDEREALLAGIQRVHVAMTQARNALIGGPLVGLH
ncbi:MAG TPA: hypothetical protein VGE10_01680 [Zeimonas sp.]